MKRLPWFLLAVSLAFNISFAVGLLKARSDMEKAKTFSGRAELMARELNLNDQQQKEFQTLLDQAEKIRAQYAPQREAYLAELIKDKPDAKALEDYMVGDTARQRRLAMLELTRKMMAVLTPQQRQQFTHLCSTQNASSK